MSKILNVECSCVNTAFIANPPLYLNNTFMDKSDSQQQAMLQRVNERLKTLNMSWAEFARRLGTTDQRVYNWRKRGVPKSEADKVASILECSTDWLLTGVHTAREPPAAYANTEPGPDVRGFVPLISWVAAGAWTAVEDPYEVGDAEQWVPCPVSHGHRTFVLRVRGDSMEPEYRNEDWIFVDPDRQPENGSHVVVRMEDAQEATFKKLVIEGGHRYLVALNPAWPSRIIEINGNATIVGVVVFSGKPRA